MPSMASWNPALHPRAPAGGPAGGQFDVGGSKAAPAKTAPAKAAPKPKAKKTTSKNNAAAKAAQAKARSVPFAELKRLTTIANNGGKLTSAQAAIVKAGETAHANHEQHLAVVAAKGKPKATVKAKAKTVAKAKTAAKPKAKAAPKPKTAPKPTTPAQIKANAAAFRL